MHSLNDGLKMGLIQALKRYSEKAGLRLFCREENQMFHTEKDNLSGIELNGKTINLYYQKKVTRYTISYSYDHEQGNVTGVEEVEAGGSFNVLVEPEKGYEIANVKSSDGNVSNNGNVYTISEVNQNVTVSVTFDKVKTYKIGTSNQSNLSVTYNSRTYPSNFTSTYTAGGKSIGFTIRTNQSNKQEFELNSLQIKVDDGNYQNIRLPGDLSSGDSVTTELSDGTRVTVVENDTSSDGFYSKTIHNYTVTIRNSDGIYGDIDMRINCKDVSYKEAWVQELNGIDAVTWYGKLHQRHAGDHSFKYHGISEALTPGTFTEMENNEDYYFYVKVLPGYDAENISLSVAGMDTELKELTSNTIGYTEAKRDGYTHYFKITTTSNRNEAKNVRIIISAPYASYNVRYDFAGGNIDGETSYTDTTDYSMVEGKDSFAIGSGLLPVKENFTFQGWEFNGKTYKTNEIFTLTEESLASVSGDEIVFKAVWESVETSDQAPYTIKATFEQPEGGYAENPDVDPIVKYGAPNATVFIMTDNAPKYEGYELDLSQNYTATIDPKGTTVITLYYNFIRDELKYDANAVDATGTTEPTKGIPETEVKVADNGYTRQGYKFVEWSTERDGSGDSYKPGEMLWSSVFVTLVAKKYRFMQFELDMVFDTR